MAPPGAVRLVTTPLRLSHESKSTHLTFAFPWRPVPPESRRPSTGQRSMLSNATASAYDDGGGTGLPDAVDIAVVATGLRYEPIPLSVSDEQALGAAISTALRIAPTTAGRAPVVVGVRQTHYAPLTPLRMLPLLPPPCLLEELEVVLGPAAAATPVAAATPMALVPGAAPLPLPVAVAVASPLPPPISSPAAAPLPVLEVDALFVTAAAARLARAATAPRFAAGGGGATPRPRAAGT
eukprot:COSAG01_NODE_3131_length_6533_cov_6.407212_6_plen_238_part_00